MTQCLFCFPFLVFNNLKCSFKCTLDSQNKIFKLLPIKWNCFIKILFFLGNNFTEKLIAVFLLTLSHENQSESFFTIISGNFVNEDTRFMIVPLFSRFVLQSQYYTAASQNKDLRDLILELWCYCHLEQDIFLNTYKTTQNIKGLPESVVWAVSRTFFISFGCKVFTKSQI